MKIEQRTEKSSNKTNKIERCIPSKSQCDTEVQTIS